MPYVSTTNDYPFMGGFRIKVIEVDCPIGIDGVRRLKYYANNNKLYWNSVSNASKYNVYYSQSSSNDLTAYSAGTFYFVVIAINNNVKSSYSSPAYCTIQNNGGGSGSGGNSDGGNGGGSTSSLPSAPTGLAGSRQGPAMYPYVYLNWNYTSVADSYIIYHWK